MDYSCTTLERSPQPVLVIERRAAQAEIGKTITEVLPLIFEFALANRIPIIGSPVCRYPGMGPGPMTIQPGIPISAPVDIPSHPEIKLETLPGGLLALTTHMGPYDRLGEAMTALGNWIQAQNLTPAAPPWESYVTNPGDYPDPKDWKTDIYWPVAPTRVIAP